MSPMFAHGQLRLYLLSLLAQGPRHGYELMQDLEARFGGLYTPSAGTVYPRLAKLEEEGLVERTDEGRKATYRLTDAGRAEVQTRGAEIDDLEADVDQSVRRLAEQVRDRVHGLSAGLRAELETAAREARAAARPVGSPDWAAPGSRPREWPDDRADPPPRSSGPSPQDDRAGWWPTPGDVPPSPPPPPGPPWSPRGRGRGNWSDATDWVDVESAVHDLRRQARKAWRAYGITAGQAMEVADILAEASRRIAEVIRRGG